MKKFLLSLAVGMICLAAFSQTTNTITAPGLSLNTNTSPPTLTFGASITAVFDALATATNWTVIGPYATYVRDQEKHRNLWGGGVGAVYNLSPYAGTMIRMDMVDDDFYMVSGNLVLQVPFDSFNGALRSTPFGFVGAAEPFGPNAKNGLVGIVGAGWDFKFPKLSQHWSMAFDAEYWSDRPGVQWRFAPFVFKF